MKTPYDVIKRPVLTEKSYMGIAEKNYVFEVAINANKVEIKEAIERIFGVKVASVHTARVEGKLKRQGRHEGYRPDRKKAFVQLKEDSKAIEFFESMAQ